MQLINRYKRETTVLGIIILFLAALLIINVIRSTPDKANATITQLLGTANQTSNNPAASASPTDQQIASLQQKLKIEPKSAPNNAKLGLAYLQKAREAGDPTFYNKAEAVFKKSLELDPKNYEALGGLGALSLSRHQFEKGLEYGQQALALNPTSYSLGVIADAQIELGRYDEATATVQTMVNIRPDISSYARVSYIRELFGEYDGAIEAMKEAVDAGAPGTENRAWVTYQLGNLYYNRGDFKSAEKIFNDALLYYPNYFYAQAGLAKIYAARGDISKGIGILADVTRRMPLPEFIIELGDLYTLANQTREAGQQYKLVEGIMEIYRDNGVDTDMEMALFQADHNSNLTGALAGAKQKAYLRQSYKTADVLAWTLYKSGDYKGAAEASRQALRLGTQDRLAFFHAGMIANKLGQKEEARSYLQKALINPGFSFLYAAEARLTLAAPGN